MVNLRGRNVAGGRSNLMELVKEIQDKGSLTIPAETVRREIRQFFVDGEAAGVTNDRIKISLVDPISKLRIRVPVRSTECGHLQRFDLYHFLEFSLGEGQNSNKNAWRCPHCQAEAKQGQLRIDGYFQGILLEIGPEPQEVELFPEGNWKAVEQMDFKELSGGDDDIVEIIPKKRAENLPSDVPNSAENPQTSNNPGSGSAFADQVLDHDEEGIPSKETFEALKAMEQQLREILGLSADESVVDAVRKLKQKLEEEKGDDLDDGGGGEEAAVEEGLHHRNDEEEEEQEVDEEVEHGGEEGESVDEAPRRWVEIGWRGQLPPGAKGTPFSRPKKVPCKEVLKYLRETFGGINYECRVLMNQYVIQVALREADAARVVEGLQRKEYFGCELSSKMGKRIPPKSGGEAQSVVVEEEGENPADENQDDDDQRETPLKARLRRHRKKKNDDEPSIADDETIVVSDDTESDRSDGEAR